MGVGDGVAVAPCDGIGVTGVFGGTSMPDAAETSWRGAREVYRRGVVGDALGLMAGELNGVGMNISSPQEEICKPSRVTEMRSRSSCPGTVKYLLVVDSRDVSM